jgi:hypothetical protein
MRRIKSRYTGGILTVAVSFLIIFIQFTEVFHEPNNISFAASGDGMKSTFTTLYHIKYDTSYWYTMSMNYPYGESVFFTGNQVFATNSLKFLKELGIDLSGSALGILNLWLLLSWVIASLFLFLIFKELKLSDWIAVIGALILTFLSPQWDRFGGHYNLAYGWVFPIMFYLWMKFYKKPTLTLTVIIAFFFFIICGKQLYFLAIGGLLGFVIFTWWFFSESERFGGKWKVLLHFAIQIIIPFIVFSFFTSVYDQNIDRTAFPWGFRHYTTRLESIFLPLGEPYGKFIQISGSWKTVAYVGLTGTIVFLAVIYLAIRRGFKNGPLSAFRITEIQILNLFFWASVISLLVSLGLPFTLGLEDLLNYTGPFRQFRAVGRFIFPFYYILGILSIYILYNWQKQNKKNWIKYVFVLAILFYGYDAWLNLDQNTAKHINKLEALNDRENRLERNQWVHHYDWNSFQAIMPIPYFHVGSENYWLNDVSPNHADAYIASLKTGLPLNAVMLSRTSLGESLKNIDLVLEPQCEYGIGIIA